MDLLEKVTNGMESEYQNDTLDPNLKEEEFNFNESNEDEIIFDLINEDLPRETDSPILPHEKIKSISKAGKLIAILARIAKPILEKHYSRSSELAILSMALDPRFNFEFCANQVKDVMPQSKLVELYVSFFF